MPMIPAVCDQCNSIFSSGIFVDNAVNVSFSGNKAGPCPRCNAMGHIPDGVFNIVGNTIEVLKASERSINELKRFTNLLKRLDDDNTSLYDLKKDIERETPGMASLLPMTRKEKREDIKFGIVLLIQVFMAIITLSTTSQNEEEKDVIINQNIEVNQVINQVYESNMKQKAE